MEAWIWIVIAVAAVVVIALVAWLMMTRRRTEGLREQFGPEYDATVTEAESRRSAEAELEARRERRERLTLRALTPETRDRYAQQWRDVQARFVDSPAVALQSADLLVTELMRDRGYPTNDFEQQAADVSVDHPEVVRNYRSAHTISEESSSGSADTERMREGLVHYRSLFDELLEEDTPDTDREAAG
jgi:hypothetical protein